MKITEILSLELRSFVNLLPGANCNILYIQMRIFVETLDLRMKFSSIALIEQLLKNLLGVFRFLLYLDSGFSWSTLSAFRVLFFCRETTFLSISVLITFDFTSSRYGILRINSNKEIHLCNLDWL